MSAHDTEETLFVSGFGMFEAQYDSGMFGLICFTKLHEFHDQPVELLVYPNEDGTWPSESQRHELLSRYRRFDSDLQSTLQQLPAHIHALCKYYEIESGHLTDSEIISGVVWENIKLEPCGEIECYAVHEDLNSRFASLVIRFAAPNKIAYAYFDG